MANDGKRTLAIGAVVMLVAAASAAQGGKRDSQRLPPIVKQAIDANKPGAEIDKLEVEKEAGITLYDIEFKDRQGEIEVAEDGTVMDVTNIVGEKDVPEAAVQAIKTAAKGKAVKQYEKSEVRAEIVKGGDKGRISKLAIPKYVYEAELTEGEVEVTPDGKVIKAAK